MKRINIQKLKENIPQLLAELKKGKKIILCKRNEPVAEITAIQPEVRTSRTFGKHKGWFTFDFEKFQKEDLADDFELPIVSPTKSR